MTERGTTGTLEGPLIYKLASPKGKENMVKGSSSVSTTVVSLVFFRNPLN